LGIGRGYVAEDNYDKTDYPGQLWDILRDERDRPKSRSDQEILDEAADCVTRNGKTECPQPLSFKAERWAAFLIKHDIPWPFLETGSLDLSDETFRQMARRYPQVAPMRELRYSLSQMRLAELPVGADGRNRCMLSAFCSRTGRNQPSNAKFLFGPSVWLRGLIRPEPGRAIAYVDWSQQEFGIGAALSGDVAMQDAYLSGDPYLSFAKQAKAVPADATKKSHPDERDQYKICSLAVQYGMGQQSLAVSLGKSEALARHLLGMHKEVYWKFWQWSQGAVDHAMVFGRLHTVFGWEVHVGNRSNPRSLANFPCQANGAEMLRLACCMLTEQGVKVCAPVHDAVLIEASEDKIHEVIEQTQDVMREASRVILDGFELRSDVNVMVFPERYMDDRGARMWNKMMRLLEGQERRLREFTDAEF